MESQGFDKTLEEKLQSDYFFCPRCGNTIRSSLQAPVMMMYHPSSGGVTIYCKGCSDIEWNAFDYSGRLYNPREDEHGESKG